MLGAEDFVPNNEGKELAVYLYTVEMTDYKVGEKVVICGGGTSGSEYALELTQKGKKVTLVDMLGSEDLTMACVSWQKALLCSAYKKQELTSVIKQKSTNLQQNAWKSPPQKVRWNCLLLIQ